MKPTFLLIDASSFIHRAFHAAPARQTATGEHVGALYISIKMLRNLVNSVRPQYVTTVFDHPGITFRHQLYPEYKANRDPKPPELVSQIDRLRLVSGAMGLNPLMIKNVEADDVIATLAGDEAQESAQCLIATRDKDLAAVVSKDVSLIDKDGGITDVTSVSEKYGVPPRLITDWLTLKGDDSDNIPGIQGCGDKKAATLLNKFGSLDKIIESSREIKGVLGERIQNNIDQLNKMKAIIALKYDVPIITDLSFYSRRNLNAEALIECFDELEFSDMGAKLSNYLVNRQSNSTANINIG